MKKNFRPLLSYFAISLIISGYMIFQNIGYTDYITQTHIGVKLINSYSGSISRNTGQNIVSSGGLLWTNTTTPSIIVSANTGSDFFLSGDVSYITGSGISNYSIPTTVSLSSGDTIKYIQTVFSRDTEPYHSNILNIVLDTIPPSLPTLGGPYNNETLSGSILLSWTNSYDNGIGLSHYNIHLSLDPGFFGEIIIPVSGNTLQLLSSNLPQGTLFWYIEAIDLLGNHQSTNPYFFHNVQPSIANGGGSTNGGGHYSGGGGSTESYEHYNSHNTGYSITGYNNTGFISSGNITSHITGSIIKSGDNYQEIIITGTINGGIVTTDNNQGSLIKSTLLSKFYRLNNKDKGYIELPTEKTIKEYHNSAMLPNASIYNNLLGIYYHNLNPLGYTMNIISRLLFPLYYVVKWLQYYIRKHNIYKLIKKY